ncbi:MAG TPA: helix-turn-helix domain-containing protein [Pyrinomonadaceae bacterium]|nr:helix-turn-helix domain-containing protein [Pyrinomonadaceae bacterium]
MENDREPFRFLTLRQAAELLHVSTRTVERMIRLSQFPAFKVGGQWRVRESQFTQWIEERESTREIAQRQHSPNGSPD